MKRNFHIIVVLSLLVPLLSFTKQRPFSGDKAPEINIADSIAGFKKVPLPYEYEEWLNWIVDLYTDTGVEDETRFAYHYVEDGNEWIDYIYNESSNGEEITGFSHVGSPLFQVLDNGDKNYHSFIVGASKGGDVRLKLVNMSNDGRIISQLVLSSQKGIYDVFGFCISENFNIELYEGTLVFDDTLQRGIIKNRKVYATYQLAEDGSLSKLSNCTNK